MADVLIRDLSDATVREIGRLAQESGISRNEFLKRELGRLAPAPRQVTLEDLKRSAELTSDLLDPEIMAAAWR